MTDICPLGKPDHPKILMLNSQDLLFLSPPTKAGQSALDATSHPRVWGGPITVLTTSSPKVFQSPSLTSTFLVLPS